VVAASHRRRNRRRNLPRRKHSGKNCGEQQHNATVRSRIALKIDNGEKLHKETERLKNASYQQMYSLYKATQAHCRLSAQCISTRLRAAFNVSLPTPTLKGFLHLNITLGYFAAVAPAIVNFHVAAISGYNRRTVEKVDVNELGLPPLVPVDTLSRAKKVNQKWNSSVTTKNVSRFFDPQNILGRSFVCFLRSPSANVVIGSVRQLLLFRFSSPHLSSFPWLCT
jgi:hypothetical protein